MTDADKLNEEVKRYYSENFAYISSDQPTLSILTNIARHFYELGCRRAAEKYNEIEYNRQRAEESVPNDLEEAANNYASVTDPEAHGIDFIREVFIAGAEWRDEKSDSSETPNDLEEAAIEYAKAYTKNDNGNGGDDWEDDIKITFIAGAQWGAEHLKK